jgi:hypothetical protein
MSVQTILVVAGQALVGWAMAVPGFLGSASSSVEWLRGLRAHVVVVVGSGAVGLASLVVGGWLGWTSVSSVPASCSSVAPSSCCTAERTPSFCFHPSEWRGKGSSGERLGR